MSTNYAVVRKASKDVVTKFVNTVLQVWPPFRWEDDQTQGWIDLMIDEMGVFTDDVLNRALSDMIRTRGKVQADRRTPTPAECLNYAGEAKRWIEIEESKNNLPLDASGPAGPRDSTTERRKLAWDITTNPADPVCEAAAKEGWNGTLLGFARKYARMPNPKLRIEYSKRPGSPVMLVDEIQYCMREAQDFLEVYAFCKTEASKPEPRRKTTGWQELPFPAQSFASLGDDMLKTRNAHAEYFFRRQSEYQAARAAR